MTGETEAVVARRQFAREAVVAPGVFGAVWEFGRRNTKRMSLDSGRELAQSHALSRLARSLVDAPQLIEDWRVRLGGQYGERIRGNDSAQKRSTR